MTDDRYEVSDVIFEPDGTVLVTYMERTDLRCDGAVAVRHTARIVPNDQYRDGIDRLRGAAQTVLGDALEDWRVSPALELDETGQERAFGNDRAGEEDELESETAQRNWAAVEADRAGR